jgi:ribokinase
MSVVVVGSANLDLIYRVERIPRPGETVLALGADTAPGGKGNNQATAAARAGAHTTFIAAVGSDSAGDLLVRSLTSSGVEQRVRKVDAATGTALITVGDDADNTIVVNQGANRELLELDADDRRAIADAHVLLLQLETPLETVKESALVAHGAGTLVVLNAAPMCPLPPDLLAVVDVLIVNESEAAELAQALGVGDSATAQGGAEADPSADEESRLAKALTSLGVAVIVTLGARGALVCVPNGSPVPIEGLRVAAVDTTGAGDTFCGALVAAMDKDSPRWQGRSESLLESLVRAAEFATLAAALAVQRPGAVPSIPTLKEIEDFRTRS